jgi:hypothetical protein
MKWKLLVLQLTFSWGLCKSNPVADNETEYQVETFLEVETSFINETVDKDDNDTDIIKADVPYIPYFLHNYTGIFSDDEESGSGNGTRKEIIRQDYDFKSW